MPAAAEAARDPGDVGLPGRPERDAVYVFFLLLQKHTYKIDTLLLMGYSPNQVARPFHLLAISLNVGVLVVALIVVKVLKKYYMDRFCELYPGLEEGSLLPAVIAGLLILVIVAVLNFTAIRRKVLGVWHIHE